jgi:hypothetical protein
MYLMHDPSLLHAIDSLAAQRYFQLTSSRPTPTHVNGPAHHSSLIDSGSNANGASVRMLAMISSLSGEFEY